MEDKIKNLLDFEYLGLLYSELFKEAVVNWLSIEEAYEHGESPLKGERLTHFKEIRVQNKEQYLKYQPVFEMSRDQALIELIIENNRQMISLVKDLISQKP